MAAYTVIDVEIHDADAMQRYETAMATLVPRFGGKLLARDERATTLDGSWAPKLFVMMTFPDKDAILRFYESEDYAPLKAIRHGAARSQVIAVEGFDAGTIG